MQFCRLFVGDCLAEFHYGFSAIPVISVANPHSGGRPIGTLGAATQFELRESLARMRSRAMSPPITAKRSRGGMFGFSTAT